MSDRSESRFVDLVELVESDDDCGDFCDLGSFVRSVSALRVRLIVGWFAVVTAVVDVGVVTVVMAVSNVGSNVGDVASVVTQLTGQDRGGTTGTRSRTSFVASVVMLRSSSISLFTLPTDRMPASGSKSDRCSAVSRFCESNFRADVTSTSIGSCSSTSSSLCRRYDCPSM